MPLKRSTSKPETMPITDPVIVETGEDVVRTKTEKETVHEQQDQVQASMQEQDGAAAAIVGAVDDDKVKAVPKEQKTEEQIQIETILSEGLESVYAELPPNRQAEFKAKGEETAKKIEKLMQSVKVKMRKVASLIRDWLKMIPGVNKYFLEQESKIKADKLMEMKDVERGT